MASSNQNETNIESSHLLSSVAMITYIAWIKDKLIEEFDEMTEKIEYERGQIQHNETWKEEYEHELLFLTNDDFRNDMLRMNIRHTNDQIYNLLGNIQIIRDEYEEIKNNANWEINVIKTILNPNHIYETFDPIDYINELYPEDYNGSDNENRVDEEHNASDWEGIDME